MTPREKKSCAIKAPTLGLISAVCLGDWCSYHSALLRNVDPMNVEVIERLKKYLEGK